MKTPMVASRQNWFIRNRMMLLTLVVVVAYAAFIEWFDHEARSFALTDRIAESTDSTQQT